MKNLDFRKILVENIDFDDQKSRQIVLSLYEKYAKRATHFCEGRNRDVFVMPSNYVVKIPKNLNGIADNDWEGSISNLNVYDPEDVRYARTRLVYFKEIPIVFMEFIPDASLTEITEKMGYLPSWINSVDSCQVGFNKAQILVAYDYGIC